MDFRLIILITVMLANGSYALSEDDIPRCLQSLSERFSLRSYEVPKSIKFFANSLRKFFDDDTDEDNDLSIDSISTNLSADECQAHLKFFEDAKKNETCYDQMITSEFRQSFDTAMFNNERVYYVVVGAQLCEGYLRSF